MSAEAMRALEASNLALVESAYGNGFSTGIIAAMQFIRDHPEKSHVELLAAIGTIPTTPSPAIEAMRKNLEGEQG